LYDVIDTIAENKGAIITYMHSGGTQHSIDLDAFIKYAKSKGVDIITMAQLYALLT
jgi:PHP family Zn ribbon phosphoesterase